MEESQSQIPPNLLAIRESLAIKLLEILNDDMNVNSAIDRILKAIKEATGFDAVGIRLRNDNDFPYFSHDGFAPDFILAENSLVMRNEKGGLCKNDDGTICLECTCGLVVSGKTDPSNPLFTEGGSAWTNNSLTILDIPAEKDPRLNPRNNCIHQGYMSVALIPILKKNEVIGLLQLNDRRKECFTLEMIRFFEALNSGIGIALMRIHDEAARKKAKEDLQQKNLELDETNALLKNALENVKTLSGLLPICANCKRIRDDKGCWNQIEVYIKDHSDANFSHGLCPTCSEKLYPEYYRRKSVKE